MRTLTEKTAKAQLQEFKEVFCDKINIDPKTGNYVKLNVENYQRLNFMRYYLLKAIEFTAFANEHEHIDRDETSNTITYLVNILLELDEKSLFQGIDKLLELE